MYTFSTFQFAVFVILIFCIGVGIGVIVTAVVKNIEIDHHKKMIERKNDLIRVFNSEYKETADDMVASYKIPEVSLVDELTHIEEET